jgi:hypothetical protein
MTARTPPGPIGPRLTPVGLRRLRIPEGAALANTDRHAANTENYVRYYYQDRPFTCKRCSTQEVWSVRSQQFWYEQCKGSIYAVAVLCRRCRKGAGSAREAKSPAFAGPSHGHGNAPAA